MPRGFLQYVEQQPLHPDRAFFPSTNALQSTARNVVCHGRMDELAEPDC